MSYHWRDGLAPATTHSVSEDDLSPLLTIGVSPTVVTPRGTTPPSPWAASTCLRPQQNPQVNQDVPSLDLTSASEVTGSHIPGKVPLFKSGFRPSDLRVEDSASPDLPLRLPNLPQPIVLDNEKSQLLERSSFGILSAETLANQSRDFGDQSQSSFAFPALNELRDKMASLTLQTPPKANEEIIVEVEGEEDVFKVPEVPQRNPTLWAQNKSLASELSVAQQQKKGLPANLLTATLMNNSMKTGLNRFQTGFETMISTNSSLNHSSFAWDKIVAMNETREGIDDHDLPDVSLPESTEQLTGAVSILKADDAKFDEMNHREEDSFMNGQFSARSTSFGGSNESDGGNGSGEKVRTRDERFSDFTQRSKLFNNNETGENHRVSTASQRNFNSAKGVDLEKLAKERAIVESLGLGLGLAKGHTHDGPREEEAEVSLLASGPEDFLLKVRQEQHSFGSVGFGPIAAGDISLGFGNDGVGGSEFEGQDFADGAAAKAFLDEAEREFEKEHRFDAPVHATANNAAGVGGQQLANVTGVSCFSTANTSFKPVSGENEGEVDALSRSGYFLANTSRLGSLESGLDSLFGMTPRSDTHRPNLGFSKIESPPSKMPQTKQRPQLEVKTGQADVKNTSSASVRSTFTVSRPGSAAETKSEGSDFEKSKLEENITQKLDAFKDLELDQIKSLVSQVSNTVDPNFFAQLIKSKAKDVQSSTSSPNQTVSDLLPSFLEITNVVDKTKVIQPTTEETSRSSIEDMVKARDQKIALSKVNKTHSGSKIPKMASGSKLPKPAASTSNSLVKKKQNPVRGQRFSSPIKQESLPKSDGLQTQTVKKTCLFNEKENLMGQSRQRANSASRQPLTTQNAKNESEEKGPFKKPEVPKVTLTHPTPPVPPKTSMQQKRVFPLETDRAIVNWLAVNIGRSEEQLVVLRNTQKVEVRVNLMIRESEDFKIGLASNQSVVIPPMSTHDVAVTFSPSRLGFCRGKLVLKPQGQSQNGSTSSSIKATVLLQGHGGCSKVEVKGFGDYISGRRSLNLGRLTTKVKVNHSLAFTNSGNGVAFVKLHGFRDPDCRLRTTFITFSPSHQFVVPPGQTKAVVMTFDPDHEEVGIEVDRTGDTFLGTVAMFTGPEIARQVMMKARTLPGAARLSSSASLLGLDFTETFDSLEEVNFDGKVTERDVRHFYEKTTKELVELTGVRVGSTHASDIGGQKFNQLTVEDTLSETRFNCTVDASLLTSPPKVVEVVKPKPVHAAKPVLVKSKTVYLDSEEIAVPRTAVGGRSIAKISLKNRSAVPGKFGVKLESRHFRCKHTQVTVQPGSYLNIPVYYEPLTSGIHQCLVLFECEDGKNRNLTAKIVSK